MWRSSASDHSKPTPSGKNLAGLRITGCFDAEKRAFVLWPRSGWWADRLMGTIALNQGCFKKWLQNERQILPLDGKHRLVGFFNFARSSVKLIANYLMIGHEVSWVPAEHQIIRCSFNGSCLVGSYLNLSHTNFHGRLCRWMNFCPPWFLLIFMQLFSISVEDTGPSTLYRWSCFDQTCHSQSCFPKKWQHQLELLTWLLVGWVIVSWHHTMYWVQLFTAK